MLTWLRQSGGSVVLFLVSGFIHYLFFFFFAPYLNMSEPDTAGLNCSETLVIQSLSKHMDNGADLMDRGSADLPVPTVTVVRGSMKDTCLFWV